MCGQSGGTFTIFIGKTWKEVSLQKFVFIWCERSVSFILRGNLSFSPNSLFVWVSFSSCMCAGEHPGETDCWGVSCNSLVSLKRKRPQLPLILSVLSYWFLILHLESVANNRKTNTVTAQCLLFIYCFSFVCPLLCVEVCLEIWVFIILTALLCADWLGGRKAKEHVIEVSINILFLYWHI